MADNSTEIKRIIDIEFKGAKTIGDIKNNITQLKKELDQCVNGSKEAAAKSLELARAQSTLTAAMKGCVDETGKLDNSYNGLVTRMNRLKIAQKQLNLETDEGKKKFKEYAEEINRINNKLKDADAMNGVYTRNVGNYTSALGSMGGQFGKLAGTIDKTATAMQNLKVKGGWLAGVAAIIAGISAAINTNQQAVDRLKIAWAPFEGLFNRLYVGAQNFGDAMSKSISNNLNALSFIAQDIANATGDKETLKKMKEAKEIAREQERLEKERLAAKGRLIEYEKEEAKWRAEYIKWKKDDEKGGEAAANLEAVRLNKALDAYLLAMDEYNLQVKINSQTESKNKDLDKELDLLRQMTEAESELQISGEKWSKYLSTAKPEAALKAMEDLKNGINEVYVQYVGLVNQSPELAAARFDAFMQVAKDEIEAEIKVNKEREAEINSHLSSGSKFGLMLKQNLDSWVKQRQLSEETVDRAKELITLDDKHNKAILDGLTQYFETLKTDRQKILDEQKKDADEEAKKAAETLEQKRQDLINKVNTKSSVLEQYVLAYFTEFNAKRVEDLTIPQLQKVLNSWNEVMAKDADYFSKIMLERFIPENGVAKIRERVERYRTELEKTITDVDVKQKREEIIKFIQDLESGIETIYQEIEDIDKLDITNEQADIEKAPLIQLMAKYNTLLEEQTKKLQNLSKDSIIADMVKNVGKEFEIKVPVVVDEPEEEDIDKDLQKRITAIRNRIDTTLHQYNHETKSLKEEYEQQQKDLQIALNTKLITQEEYNRSMKNLDKDYLDAKRSIIYEEIGLYAEMASSIGSILGSIADMWEDDLRTKVEHGEMTQEQAEKEFEDVKAFQIAEAVINTITGAISGYAGAAGNSGINSIPYVGPFLAQAVGITNAAAVTASGIAQIAKIKNTQFGSSSISSGGYGSGNQSFQLPALETFKPNYSQNLTSASDTTDLAQSVATAIGQQNIRAFVVESDITNAQQRSSKRQSEATW